MTLFDGEIEFPEFYAWGRHTDAPFEAEEFTTDGIDRDMQNMWARYLLGRDD